MLIPRDRFGGPGQIQGPVGTRSQCLVGADSATRTRIAAAPATVTNSGRARGGWSGWWDSNPRPRAPKARALPLRYTPTDLSSDSAWYSADAPEIARPVGRHGCVPTPKPTSTVAHVPPVSHVLRRRPLGRSHSHEAPEPGPRPPAWQSDMSTLRGRDRGSAVRRASHAAPRPPALLIVARVLH
jgi:hypothetical protein